MTVDRDNTTIFDQHFPFHAEGTSIEYDAKPTVDDIKKLLITEDWICEDINIWFDDLQGFWRWSCDIIKLTPTSIGVLISNYLNYVYENCDRISSNGYKFKYPDSGRRIYTSYELFEKFKRKNS